MQRRRYFSGAGTITTMTLTPASGPASYSVAVRPALDSVGYSNKSQCRFDKHQGRRGDLILMRIILIIEKLIYQTFSANADKQRLRLCGNGCQ
jgi:hypothetical protein